MTDRYKWSSGIQSSMQDSQGDVLVASDIPVRLNEQDRRIAELEKQLELATKIYLDGKDQGRKT